jgi:protein required for attachment to host cells
MAITWILLANSSRARVCESDGPKLPLREVADFTHPESRMHEQELTSDLPGRAFDSGGEGRHAMGQSVEPKQQHAIQFAKEIADYLEAARNEAAFSRLYVIAAPAFLGLLRQHYSASLASLVTGEVDKDLTSLNLNEVEQYLPFRF